MINRCHSDDATNGLCALQHSRVFTVFYVEGRIRSVELRIAQNTANGGSGMDLTDVAAVEDIDGTSVCFGNCGTDDTSGGLLGE